MCLVRDLVMLQVCILCAIAFRGSEERAGRRRRLVALEQRELCAGAGGSGGGQSDQDEVLLSSKVLLRADGRAAEVGQKAMVP